MNTETMTIKQLQKAERKQARKTKTPKVEAPKAEASKLNDQVPVEQIGSEAEAPKPKGKRGLAATMARYRAGYVDGKSCGDNVASRLAGMSLDAVLAEASALCGEDLAVRYAHLNNGQKRMTAGNRIRSAAKKAQKEQEAQKAD